MILCRFGEYNLTLIHPSILIVTRIMTGWGVLYAKPWKMSGSLTNTAGLAGPRISTLTKYSGISDKPALFHREGEIQTMCCNGDTHCPSLIVRALFLLGRTIYWKVWCAFVWASLCLCLPLSVCLCLPVCLSVSFFLSFLLSLCMCWCVRARTCVCICLCVRADLEMKGFVPNICHWFE